MTSELIASFDIGKKNFAFCIEEVNTNKLKTIKNIPKNERYNKDGTPTKKFEKILKALYKCGNVIMMCNLDITENCNDKKYIDPQLYINLTDTLDKYQEYWNKCSTFIIEKQMSFRNKHNTMAIKVGQHCFSYFSFYYRNFKTILEYPAYHKTQVLGAPKDEVKKKPQRKKWAVKKSFEILEERRDEVSTCALTSSKKKDDMADCLLMTITYTYLHFINKIKF